MPSLVALCEIFGRERTQRTQNKGKVSFVFAFFAFFCGNSFGCGFAALRLRTLHLGGFALKSLGPESGGEITGSNWSLKFEADAHRRPANPKKKTGSQLFYR